MDQTSNNETDDVSSQSETLSKWPPRLGPLVLGGLVGVLVGWGILSFAFPLFTIPESVALLPDPPPIAAIEKLEAYQFDVDNKNYGIAFAITGAIVALLCTTFSYGFHRTGSILLSLVAGGLFGGAGAILCNIVTTRTRAVGGNDVNWFGVKLDSMGQAMLAQSFLWGLIGLATGVAVGMSGKGPSGAIKAGVSGLLGGAVGAIVFLLASATINPTSSSNYVVLRSTAEQITLMLTAVTLICVSIKLGTGERKAKSTK